MKNLIPLVGLCAAFAAFGASPYNWEGAVKPDAPSPSDQPAVQVNLAAQSSKISSMPLFYSAVRNIPPLPFNPHPELPLFELGANRFMYDDSQVDYSSLFSAAALANGEVGGEASTMSSPSPCNPCSTNGSGGGGSGRENHNPPYVDFHSDPFPIRRTTQTNDLIALTNALKDFVIGSWLFEGHAGPKDIIPGGDGWLTVRLTATNVARCLGNEFIAASPSPSSTTVK